LISPTDERHTAAKPRLRDCRACVRELRLHQLDRTLHAFWERLPLRELRIVGTVTVLGVGVYLLVVRRGSIEHSLSRVGSAQPGWIAVAVAAELVSLVCYAALVRVLLQLGAVTVPFRALFSLTVIGIAMINSVPGGQAISTIYWYEQLRRYSVQRSVAAFALLVSSLLGIVTLVLLAGLISESENKQRQGIPLLDSIPGVGDAFSHQTTARARTELILFIRPTVIKDALDAHVIAEQMRSKMNSRLVGTSQPVVVIPKATR